MRGILTFFLLAFTPAASTPTVQPPCAVVHIANGRQSLERWVHLHPQHSVTEVITASLTCHSGVWPRPLAQYMDAGFLHRPMPKGMRFYTVAGS